MIDDEGDAAAAALAGPGCGEDGKGHAVGTTGNPDGELRRGAEGTEFGHRPPEQGGQAFGRIGRQRQAARRRAARTWLFSAGDGEENWLVRESSVSHASWFWWIADRELARPSRA